MLGVVQCSLGHVPSEDKGPIFHSLSLKTYREKTRTHKRCKTEETLLLFQAALLLYPKLATSTFPVSVDGNYVLEGKL